MALWPTVNLGGEAAQNPEGGVSAQGAGGAELASLAGRSALEGILAHRASRMIVRTGFSHLNGVL